MKKLILIIILLTSAICSHAQFSCNPGDWKPTNLSVTITIGYTPSVAVHFDAKAGTTLMQAFVIPKRLTSDSSVAGIVSRYTMGALEVIGFTTNSFYLTAFQGIVAGESYYFCIAVEDGSPSGLCYSAVYDFSIPGTPMFCQTPGCMDVSTGTTLATVSQTLLRQAAGSTGTTTTTTSPTPVNTHGKKK